MVHMSLVTVVFSLSMLWLHEALSQHYHMQGDCMGGCMTAR